jgi:mannose-6-phosphate isomerase-like protein (cupin superfamily)
MDAKGFVPGQGPVWDMGPGRSAALKMQNGETAEERDDVRGSRAARRREAFHPHHDSDELTYVLSGEITFKIGDEVTVGGPGA